MIKLKSFGKIVNNNAPQYLQSLVPPTVSTNRPQSRNADKFKVPKARTETFKSSFLLSTVRLWNTTPSFKRSPDYIKEALATKSNFIYSYGTRNVNIVHSQLRMKCSKLNNDLFHLHVVDTPECICGHKIENSYHYFFDCPMYRIQRIKLMHDLMLIIDKKILLDVILFGDPEYSISKNVEIFDKVHEFIRASGRFA